MPLLMLRSKMLLTLIDDKKLVLYKKLALMLILQALLCFIYIIYHLYVIVQALPSEPSPTSPQLSYLR